MKIKREGLRYFSLLVLFLSLTLIFGCSDHPPKEVPYRDKPGERIDKKNKPGSSYSDSIKVSSPAAVFYLPDSLQLEKLRVITDPGIFNGTMHDCFYQIRNCRRILKQYYKHIRIIEVKNARYVIFEKMTGEKEYLDLNTQNDPCGLFIFDGRKSSKLVDMTNIETELGFYFTK